MASVASFKPSSISPSLRITQEKPRPCPTSVTRITANVTSNSRSRWGKGAPFAISGIDNTAASETAPRTPVKAMTKTWRRGSAGVRQFCGNRRPVAATVNTQAKRTAITTAQTAAAAIATRIQPSGGSRPAMARA